MHYKMSKLDQKEICEKTIKNKLYHSHIGRTFKVIVIGESGVGKSCIVDRIIFNEFQNTNATIGAALFLKELYNQKTNKTDIFQIWDTAGQENYRSIIPLYYKNTHIALVVYSVVSRDSFDMVHIWIDNIMTHASKHKVIDDNFPLIVLIGNKTDLKNEEKNKEKNNFISCEEGNNLIEHLEKRFPKTLFYHFLTSAKIIDPKAPNIFEEILMRASVEIHDRSMKDSLSDGDDSIINISDASDISSISNTSSTQKIHIKRKNTKHTEYCSLKCSGNSKCCF
jgi:small GTP-binding protein